MFLDHTQWINIKYAKAINRSFCAALIISATAAQSANGFRDLSDAYNSRLGDAENSYDAGFDELIDAVNESSEGTQRGDSVARQFNTPSPDEAENRVYMPAVLASEVQVTSCLVDGVSGNGNAGLSVARDQTECHAYHTECHAHHTRGATPMIQFGSFPPVPLVHSLNSHSVFGYPFAQRNRYADEHIESDTDERAEFGTDEYIESDTDERAQSATDEHIESDAYSLRSGMTEAESESDENSMLTEDTVLGGYSSAQLNLIVTSSEALTDASGIIQAHYIDMIMKTVVGDYALRLMPAPVVAAAEFEKSREILTRIYFQTMIRGGYAHHRFKIRNALQTLRLIAGDTEMPKHFSSRTADYGTYHYEGFPATKQFVTFIHRVCIEIIDQADFVKTTLATWCTTPDKWNTFRLPFMQCSRFHPILNQETCAYALAMDAQTGGHFVNAFVRSLNDEILPAPGTIRMICALYKAYQAHIYEKLNPLTEALFMGMRGHNIRLLDENEPNSPACAHGVYLGLMKAIGELVFVDIPGIELMEC